LTLKNKKGKSGKHFASCNTLKTTKSLNLNSSGRQELPLQESQLANFTLPKKDSLKLHLQSLDRLSSSRSRPKRKEEASWWLGETKRWDDSNF
jgi:hypothetical protein